MKIYQDYFEPEVVKKPNGITPSGRGGWNRGRGRGGHLVRGGAARNLVPVPVTGGGVQPVVPDSNAVAAIEKLKAVEDHSDKQWTESMLSNLMHCNQIGKKHALKKYDQFALNNSCFWGGTYHIKYYPIVVQFHKIFVTKHTYVEG